MKVPVFDGASVFEIVTPALAIERVRDGFVRHFEGAWSMPAKVYLDSGPHGDFRAMPALGDGIALLKWVTSFPGNPHRGLPTVTGTILLSDALTGELRAVVDGRAVTALRTGAAAAIAALALARPGAKSVGLIGCGSHGRWAAKCLAAAGYGPGICNDVDPDTAARLADEIGWRRGTREEAASCDVVTLVTPGHETVLNAADLTPGIHINALGADGPGKLEIDLDATTRCHIFCDEWTQAVHGGEIHACVDKGLVTRADVTELGAVLAGEAEGRRSDEEMTLFDSTGLAIQDLAVSLAVLERADGLTRSTIEL
jgi:alanine dehydrogenase